MLNKILIVGALALAPLVMSETASAEHCRGYGYRAPVARYYAPNHGHYHNHYRSNRVPVYSNFYGSPYRSSYGGYGGFGGYGGYGPYGPYGRGTSIGIGRGGVRLNFGF